MYGQEAERVTGDKYLLKIEHMQTICKLLLGKNIYGMGKDMI